MRPARVMLATAVLAGTALLPAAISRSAVSPTAGLSTAQLAGQRIVCGFQGRQLPADVARLIGRGELAGVILFSNNVRNAKQLRRLTAALQGVARPAGLRQPLLVMADQEGGEVKRLPAPPKLSAAAIGARGALFARHQGARTGKALRGLGVNVDLAPVLDVARPRGFISAQHRGFGSSAAAVSAGGVAFAQGLQARGTAATAKHFPGLGSTAANTDLGPVSIGLSAAKLRRIDESPYTGFVAAGGKLVMISSARYPALDPSLPASQSPAISTGELRGRLGFTGVSISDALGVPGVTGVGVADKTAMRVAAAGTDLLLYTSCASAAPAAVALQTALGSGALQRADFETSVARVLALRASLG